MKATRYEYGDPRLPARFWAKVQLGDLGCWLWTGHLHHGYGFFWDPARPGQRAHQAAYRGLVGEIPDGLQIDHLCRVRNCVNPAHLEAVTGRTNSLRGVGPSALHARATHCARGHEFTPENTYTRPSRPGERSCRECRREDKRTEKANQRCHACGARVPPGELPTHRLEKHETGEVPVYPRDASWYSSPNTDAPKMLHREHEGRKGFAACDSMRTALVTDGTPMRAADAPPTALCRRCFRGLR